MGYVAPSLVQAKDIIWDELMRDLSVSNALPFVSKINHSELKITYTNGATFRVYGAEKHERIRGKGFDLIICDEADDPNFTDEVFDYTIGPALSDRRGRLVQIGSPKGRGRLFREWCKGQPGRPEYLADHASIQVTAIEAGILSREEIEHARRTRPARAFRQEYEAAFNAPIGIIYDEWDEKVHIVNDAALPRDGFDEIIVGVDWGTSNRGAMVVIGLDRVYVPAANGLAGYEAARAWVLHEETHAGMGYDDGGWWAIARDIQQRFQPRFWYADPAGGVEGYIRQLKNALVFGGRATVVPAINDVRPGIATVREFMHHDEVLKEPPRFFVHQSCGTLRRELGAYRYQSVKSNSDEFTESPLKVEDHLCDAARYALHSHFGQARGRKRAA